MSTKNTNNIQTFLAIVGCFIFIFGFITILEFGDRITLFKSKEKKIEYEIRDEILAQQDSLMSAKAEFREINTKLEYLMKYNIDDIKNASIIGDISNTKLKEYFQKNPTTFLEVKLKHKEAYLKALGIYKRLATNVYVFNTKYNYYTTNSFLYFDDFDATSRIEPFSYEVFLDVDNGFKPYDIIYKESVNKYYKEYVLGIAEEKL